MCTGNEVSTVAVAMGNLEADDLITELESYSPHLDLVNPLMDLTPGRKHLMSKYLTLKEDEPWPLLAEYFGVALAFAALGALIRGANGNKLEDEIKLNSPKLQRMALQVMLKGAMERLQSLAHNAQDLEDMLIESREAREKDRIAWEEEKVCLLQKLANAESDLGELKRRRGEDAKANEKVVRIYAGQEQGWKSEKKKLRHEIDMLRKDLMRQEAGGLCSPNTNPGKRLCEKCDAKEKYVNELEEKLSEKEFLIMTATEEARTEEQERNELTTRLATAEAIAAELTEKLAKEVASSTQREVVLAEVTSKQQETETKLASVTEELETAKKHLESLSLVTDNHSAMTKKLLSELTNLKRDSEDKDEMISTMLERATFVREEKEDLARELAETQAKKQSAEVEIDRWKRLAEERARLNVTGTDANRSGHRSHRSLGNLTELEKLADLQKVHAEEMNNLRSACSKQIEALENQVRMYRAEAQEATTASAPTIWNSDFQDLLTDPGFKAWFEVVKGRYAAQLEEKHWHQIETFERQLRAKDERLSVFRSRLLDLESELTRSKLEVEELKRKPSAGDNRCTSLVSSIGKDQETQPQKSERDPGNQDSDSMALSLQKLVENLQMELVNVKKRLKEQEAEHEANLAKMTENAESELQQKDVQLAVLEAKLCQVKLQLEKAKRASEVASSDNLHEKMFLRNIDETREPPLKKVLRSASYDVCTLENKISDAQKQIDLEGEKETSLLELVQQEESVSESARLLSKLKDMCLKEEKSTAMVLFHKNLDSEACDSLLFSPDHCWLPAVQNTSIQPMQTSQPETGFTFPTKLPQAASEDDNDFTFPTNLPHPGFEDENVPALTRNLSRSHSRKGASCLIMHKKGRKSMNKQPHSPEAISYQASSQATSDNVLLTQAPTKGTRPARFDMLNVLEEHHPQRTLFTEKAGPQAPTSPVSSVGSCERKETRTREDIQVLGLALEVRRIEQQLAQMNRSAAVSPPLKTHRANSKVPVVKKQTKRCAGLAGRVSQFAKQIGLTSGEPSVKTNPYNEDKGPSTQDPSQSELSLHKNPLFSQDPSTSELALLQQRAETVAENLAAIQAKLEREGSPDSLEQYSSGSLFPKGQLVDTVRTHLSQVQRALQSKLAQITSELGDSPPSKRITQVHSKAPVKEVHKPIAAFGRRETRPSKLDAQPRQGTRKARTQVLLQRWDTGLQR